MTHPRFVLLILLFFSFTNTQAQHRIFESFTEKEGLPSNTVYDMVQDQKGYMWFATDNGLCKFDGKTFITYGIKDGLPDNEILKLFKDSKNRIWLMGFNGEVGYLQNGHFFNQYNTKHIAPLSSKNGMDTAFEDADGNIWFYGRRNKFRCFTSDSRAIASEHAIPGLFLKTFIEDSKKSVYLLSNYPSNILLKLTITNNSLVVDSVAEEVIETLFSLENFAQLRAKGFYAKTDTLGMRIYADAKQTIDGFNAFWPPKIYQESPGKYWLISNFTGLHLTKNQEKKITPIFSMADFGASSYFMDTEGNEWISSVNQGLLFFPRTNIEVSVMEKENDLQVVFKTKDSTIFVGDYNGTLYQLDKTDKPVKVFKDRASKFSETLPNKILDILEYKNYLILINNADLRIYERKNKLFTGRLAILTNGSGKMGAIVGDILYLTTSNYAYEFQLKKLLNNATWSNQKVLFFDQNEDHLANNSYRKVLWKNRCSAVLMDQNKKLWLGTNKGLFFRHKDTILPYSGPSNFKKCNITDIKETVQGTLLIATNGYGLGVIEKDTAYFINSVDEEINPIINSISIDNNGLIWLATNNGITNHILKDGKLSLQKKYTSSEGLSSKNIRTIVVMQNKIYATSPEGLNIINLENEFDQPTKDIPVYITNTTINELPKHLFNTASLKHFQNNVQFDFTGISYRSLENIKFEYRLIPWEKDWVTTTFDKVRYANLPSNTYKFEVKAIDKDGNKSLVPSGFKFTIDKAWYKSWPFYLLLAALIILSGAYLIINRLHAIRTEGEYNEKIAVLKHQALLAQMNPHFIYNSLSSIQQFILSHDIDSAQKQLTRFATLIRAILANSRKTVTTLKNEIELITNYLKLEEIRFDYQFSYTIKVHIEDADNIEITPMMIQPIVENSIIHGISALVGERKGKIVIVLKQEGAYVNCLVTDNGIGIHTAKRLKEKSILKEESLAIDNIKERLKLLNKNSKENLMQVEELYDMEKNVIGTSVSLLIPVLNHK